MEIFYVLRFGFEVWSLARFEKSTLGTGWMDVETGSSESIISIGIFSTIPVDNLGAYIGYQSYISWGISYICKIAKIIMK
ncbi:MAG: hypothetical protein R2814_04535 [Flavobacteriaceae bacterium]